MLIGLSSGCCAFNVVMVALGSVALTRVLQPPADQGDARHSPAKEVTFVCKARNDESKFSEAFHEILCKNSYSRNNPYMYRPYLTVVKGELDTLHNV